MEFYDASGLESRLTLGDIAGSALDKELDPNMALWYFFSQAPAGVVARTFGSVVVWGQSFSTLPAGMFASTTRPEAERANILYHEFWHVGSGNVGGVGMVGALIDPTFQGSAAEASEVFDNWLNVQK